MSEPVVVFRTFSDIEAAVVRGLLDSHGLRTFLSSDLPRAIFPLSVHGFSEIRVSVPAPEADAALSVIEEFRRDPIPARPQVIPFPDETAELEGRLGYPFQDRSLLIRALTHRSRVHEDGMSGEDNESLEFLGDAVLGLVVAEWLYRECPDADEGRKSKIKAALVSRSSLASIAERLDVGSALRLGRGEEKTGGRRKQALLADACEALIAAVYLDGGLDAARALLLRELGPGLDRVRRPGLITALTGDYKSALQEWLQARSEPPPVYRIASEIGPDHRKSFEVEVCLDDRVVGRAEGRTKKEAEQGAARTALVAVGALEA
jgi:ribonuclease-3